MTQFALFDRFLSNLARDQQYQHSIIQDLSKNGSDHRPLILHSNGADIAYHKMFRFNKKLLAIQEFNDLIIKWWNEIKLFGDIGTSWHTKLEIIRKKNQGLT
jgi:hypothetical protein